MTRQDALQWILSIADTYESNLIWDEYRDDELFQFGIEYGIVMALVAAFNFTKEDLICDCGECDE